MKVVVYSADPDAVDAESIRRTLLEKGHYIEALEIARDPAASEPPRRQRVTQSRQDREMAEALARATEEMKKNFALYDALAQRFFAGYAHDLAVDQLSTGERLEDRLSTALAMCFFAGRVHGELGYPSPFVEVDVDAIDDLADRWADREEGRDG